MNDREPENSFMQHRYTSKGNWKNENKKELPILLGFELFYCCATFFEKDSVTAVGTPDINVDLYLLFAPCTLVTACHL
jgi:hypothetical protein